MISLNMAGCQFQYDCLGEKRPRLENWPDGTMQALQKGEHMRNVNFRLMNGMRFDELGDDDLNLSSELVPWDMASDKWKKEYEAKQQLVFPALKRVFDKGEYPYAVVPAGFNTIIGILYDSEISTMDERLVLRMDLWNKVFGRVQKDSRFFAPKLELPKTYSSWAVMLIPHGDFSFDVLRSAFDRGNCAIMPILPLSPAEFEKRLASKTAQKRFRQLMRCAFTYYVLEGASREEMENFIRSRSNQLLVSSEASDSGVMEDKWTKGDYAYLPPRTVTKTYRLHKEGQEWEVTTA